MHCSHYGLHKSGTYNDITMNSNCWGRFHALCLLLKLLGLILVFNAATQWLKEHCQAKEQ